MLDLQDVRLSVDERPFHPRDAICRRRPGKLPTRDPATLLESGERQTLALGRR